MQFDDENIDEYEGEVDYGEEADYKYDEDKEYERAFNQPKEEVQNLEVKDEAEKTESVEYEYDEIVGARDKKPIMSKLNQRILNKHEMDDLLNEI